ncbi:muropeptide transporter [Lacunisphaera limnophila]|uniref:Muropeptide transporter n=1 Tax=Lacunisphaera limnophila TaxID=1838286 RepID=A0A1D8AT95_9BACT|nr:AmpG family muropeptide MFS transporter [Lacunisphaera limnophila]AOS44092.1 muropeptide transporter [Lacunisphaera limnophila]
MESSSPQPWRWIPSLYFAQGIPYVVVMTLSVVMYKNLGVSNTAIALYTSWLYLPWVIKPLWSPFVDLFRTKRWWIVTLQFLVGAALALVALTVPGPDFFRYTLAVFWLMAFSSATHDIAADGFYLLALPPHQQAAFVGVRSTFYRLAMIAGQGGLVYLAGALQARTGDFARAWAWVFVVLAVFFVLAGLWHLAALPRPTGDTPARRSPTAGADYLAVFASFFRKPGIGIILTYLLVYRLAEAQLLKLVTPFLLDGREAGGLGLTTQQVGIVYGTIGIIALTLGGLVGGYLISRFGLRRMLWPMILTMHAPNAVFILLAVARPESLALIGTALAVEQFGYGFGFTAYMVYMMMVADGEHKTAHYALCTGFMALGMMLPGMAAGWIQEQLGYRWFFVWVCLATLPSLLATALVKIDPAYGKKAA